MWKIERTGELYWGNPLPSPAPEPKSHDANLGSCLWTAGYSVPISFTISFAHSIRRIIEPLQSPILLGNQICTSCQVLTWSTQPSTHSWPSFCLLCLTVCPCNWHALLEYVLVWTVHFHVSSHAPFHRMFLENCFQSPFNPCFIFLPKTYYIFVFFLSAFPNK